MGRLIRGDDALTQIGLAMQFFMTQVQLRWLLLATQTLVLLTFCVSVPRLTVTELATLVFLMLVQLRRLLLAMHLLLVLLILQCLVSSGSLKHSVVPTDMLA
eukprot:TRINITY_DN9936_c0_g1_i6.p2 TRINITY_DN9936_c0_g1~~TRINITY_DN9936_c0_g1_i6.p2  ORF type:complete len:102 (+),score=13.92 TRINITY_DN9936_c0_g1_i6:299-604(+)